MQITAIAEKPTKETKCGVSFKQRTDGSFFVSNMRQDSLFAHTGLAADMTMVSINGVSVTGLPFDTLVGIISNAVGTLTLVADDAPNSSPVVVEGVKSAPHTTVAAAVAAVPMQSVISQPNAANPMVSTPQQGQLDAFHMPPPGAPHGGVWGTGKYVGGNTHALAAALCCWASCIGLIALCFKLDNRDIYMYNNQCYDVNGIQLGGPGACDFMPNPPGREHMRQGIPKSSVEDSCGPQYVRNIWGGIVCYHVCIIGCIALCYIIPLIIYGGAAATTYGY